MLTPLEPLLSGANIALYFERDIFYKRYQSILHCGIKASLLSKGESFVIFILK